MLRPLALAFLLTGCIQTAPVGLDTPDGRTALNGRAAGRAAELTLVGAPRSSVLNLHVAPDVTTWIDPRTRAPHSAPTGSVQAVTFLNRPSGALKGAALAAVAGFAVGYASSEPDFIFPRETLGFVLGALAMPIGAAAGAEFGQGTVFERLGATQVQPEATSNSATSVLIRRL